MAGNRPTIYDVAHRANVSKSLVSLVLQGSPKVSAGKRAAVEAAISELGYRPSGAATTLAAKRSQTVGVLIDDYTNLWFVDLLRGLRAVVGESGYRVLVADVASGGADTRETLDGFLSLHVDALVIASEQLPVPERVLGIPVVVAGIRGPFEGDALVVASDDALGARLAAGHLLGLGHLRLGHITGPGEAARVRAESFAAALSAVPEVRLAIWRADGTMEEDGYQGARALLAADPTLTAIFTANDVMALGAAAALREAGLRIPADVSLMGYDDSPISSSRMLDLTTIDYRGENVGADVGRVLLARLDGQEPLPPALVEPQLVQRGSTAPPR